MLWLILLAMALLEARGCEITNVSASEVTSTSLFLTWSTSDDCPVNDYSITASHLKYKACPSYLASSAASEAVLTFKAEGKQAFVQPLEPYSIYTFNISQGIDNEATLLKSDFQAETASTQPQVKLLKGQAEPQTQAIHFSWELAPELETCMKQRGDFDGFYIEIQGLENWNQNFSQNLTQPENALHYYAQNLRPFSAYQLNVYVRNRNGLYNEDLPLILKARTRPHQPLQPQETFATNVNQDIHVRWKPAYPPTGVISGYKLKYGPKSEPQIWQKEVKVANQTDFCSKYLKNFVCAVLFNLEANTTYVFQVQAFNEGYSQPSAFSRSFEAKTDPLPKPVTTTPKPANLEDSTNSSNNRGRYDPISAQIVISVVTVILIVVLVIVIACLVYKMKMDKLKARYEASQRQLQQDLNLSRSMSVIGYNESIADTTITSVSYRPHIVPNIQNRRLPDPPSASMASVQPQDFYANNPDLIAYITPDTEEDTDDHYLKPTYDSEPEDNNEYLKPTFEYPPKNLAGNLNSEPNRHATVIPTESYVSAVTLEPPRTISPLSQDNEIRPLIFLNK